jgi:predicted alpha/beta hydrolase family esterase
MSAAKPATILIVPGLRDHVEDHWQTHLAREIADSRTVPPLTSDRLNFSARVAALDAALHEIKGDVILAAHSAGVLMVAHWAQKPTRAIRAALLATPADIENPLPDGYPTLAELTANGWLPIPRGPLPFLSLVVASRNDPLATFDRTHSFALSWGANFADAGNVGHLNPAAGFGRWPAAREFIASLEWATTDDA